MQHSQLPKTLISTSIALGLTLLVGGWPMIALAHPFNPPSKGLPGRREGGGTRGVCIKEQDENLKQLTALMPRTNGGFTTDPRPTFFIYIPNTNAKAGEFELIDGKGSTVYKKTVSLTESPAVIGVKLPENIALEKGQDYGWNFTLVCSTTEPDANYFVEGWVELTQLDQKVSSDLEGATSDLAKAAAYAKNGIWFDSLAAYADLVKKEPNNNEISTNWRSFLTSVGLNPIAPIPVTFPEAMLDSSTTDPKNSANKEKEPSLIVPR